MEIDDVKMDSGVQSTNRHICRARRERSDSVYTKRWVVTNPCMRGEKKQIEIEGE